jgi:hypothetical protein
VEVIFWETAMQYGEDNSVALTNDPNDRNAILAADLCPFQLREYKAMARLAEMLGKKTEAAEYRQKTDQLATSQELSFSLPTGLFARTPNGKGSPF